MRTKHKLLGLLLTLLICLAPWNGVALAEKLPEIVAIDILTTNDFHGALVEAGKNPGAAKFGAFLLQQRAKNPYGSIFVSAGDMFQGSPDSNLLYGKTVVEVLNALQMDAMTLGNHEFDWGLDKLAARVAESRFPYVSANVREKDGQGRLSFVKPFVMLERLGAKIAVLVSARDDVSRAQRMALVAFAVRIVSAGIAFISQIALAHPIQQPCHRTKKELYLVLLSLEHSHALLITSQADQLSQSQRSRGFDAPRGAA